MMDKLAYSLGCLEALIKLGAPQVMQALTPAQKAYMNRLTEFGAPTAALPPQLAQAQRQWRHFSQSQIPELIGASEDYMTGEGKLNPEGVRRSQRQQKALDAWTKQKGQQVHTAPGVELSRPAAAVEQGTVASTPAALKAERSAAAAREAIGTAETMRSGVGAVRGATQATRAGSKGIGFLPTLVRRFAHV